MDTLRCEGEGRTRTEEQEKALKALLGGEEVEVLITPSHLEKAIPTFAPDSKVDRACPGAVAFMETFGLERRDLWLGFTRGGLRTEKGLTRHEFKVKGLASFARAFDSVHVHLGRKRDEAEKVLASLPLPVTLKLVVFPQGES